MPRITTQDKLFLQYIAVFSIGFINLFLILTIGHSYNFIASTAPRDRTFDIPSNEELREICKARKVVKVPSAESQETDQQAKERLLESRRKYKLNNNSSSIFNSASLKSSNKIIKTRLNSDNTDPDIKISINKITNNTLAIKKYIDKFRYLDTQDGIDCDSERYVDKNWLIVAFSTFDYLSVAEIWLSQLLALGYGSEMIRIYGLDGRSLEVCSGTNSHTFLNTTNICQNKILHKPPPGQLLETNTYQPGDRYYYSKIWSIRIHTVNHLIQNNNHVFISDVDTIWTKYKNLDHLFSNPIFDAYHSFGTTFPMLQYKVWGFVLNGGIAAYRSNYRMVLD